MDNSPSKEPVETKVNLPDPKERPWRNQPGWEEPWPLGVEVERSEKDGKPGDVILKVYISERVDFIGLTCFFAEGTQAQLYTRDNPPEVYELRAPRTHLILSTRPRFWESQTRVACTWIIREPADGHVWFDVDAWHWDETESEPEEPRPPVPPLVKKIHDDFLALLQLEHRADKIARRWESPIFSKWTDEEFERNLRLDHPLPNRTPEEIQALLQNAPLIRQRMQALKTPAGRKSLGLES